ncbi:hypothetical protein R6Q59_018863 [Mikania micrantha]
MIFSNAALPSIDVACVCLIKRKRNREAIIQPLSTETRRSHDNDVVVVQDISRRWLGFKSLLMVAVQIKLIGGDTEPRRKNIMKIQALELVEELITQRTYKQVGVPLSLVHISGAPVMFVVVNYLMQI